MRPAFCFLWFLCVVFLFTGRQVHASKSSAKFFHHSLSVTTVFPVDSAGKAVFESPDPGQITENADPDFGIEDDDEEREHLSKQPSFVEHSLTVFALFALPPPVSTAFKSTTA